MNFLTHNAPRVAIVPQILDVSEATTASSTPVLVDHMEEIIFVCQAGDIAATGTLSFEIQNGAAANGSDAERIKGAVVSLTATDDNAFIVFVLRNFNTAKPYLRVHAIGAVADSVISAMYIISQSRFGDIENASGATYKIINLVEDAA